MARKQLSGQNQNNLPITNVPLPQVGSDVANKTYVDTAIGSIETGSGGVVIQATPPTDTDVLWVDTDETNVDAPTLTISATQPSNPVLNDLWVDIS